VRRRAFISLLGGAAAWPLAARAQQDQKIPRLCFLTFDPGTFQSRSARFEPFFNRLNELGYVDGQTITIDYLSAEGRNERFAEIAAECLRFKADHHRDNHAGSSRREAGNSNYPDCHAAAGRSSRRWPC
jgi:putative ABC transport system substrate-binding protein